MTPPRRPNGELRDLIDTRLSNVETKILQQINTYGQRLAELDKEIAVRHDGLETRLRLVENRLAEGKGRSAAWGALGGILAAVLAAIILRGLFPDPAVLPANPATPVTPTIIVTIAPAAANAPIRVTTSRAAQNPSPRPTEMPSPTPTPSPTTSQTPGLLPRGVEVVCVLLDHQPPVCTRQRAPAGLERLLGPILGGMLIACRPKRRQVDLP